MDRIHATHEGQPQRGMAISPQENHEYTAMSEHIIGAAIGYILGMILCASYQNWRAAKREAEMERRRKQEEAAFAGVRFFGKGYPYANAAAMEFQKEILRKSHEGNEQMYKLLLREALSPPKLPPPPCNPRNN